MNTKIRTWFSVLSLVLMLGMSPALMAQTTSSAIKGNIIDSSGNVVSGASVTVQDMRTGVVRAYTSNASGAFLASRLPVGGPYKVTVNGVKEVTVDSVTLGDIYNLSIELQTATAMEEVVVLGEAATLVDTAAGPSATFSNFELETAVSFNRDIQEAYTIDPRIFADGGDRGVAINCAGKHPRFNSVTLDGVGMNDRFGLNNNGYSTATGMPFPYDAIEQVAVELAPFDVTYGGFSACNINAVTKTGTNEWEGGVWFEWNNEDLRGDTLTIDGQKQNLGGQGFNNHKRGFSVGGPILKDRLFIFAAYEEEDRPTFNAMGYAGSGNGVERPWLSETDYNRAVNAATNLWNYDPGGLPGNSTRENEKYMTRIDWNINENHNAAFIYNFTDGFQLNASDNDSNEFEFPNHFYTKGAKQTTYTAKLASQWTDSFSTELFFSTNEMDDTQVSAGPKEFGDHQISLANRNTIYMGADDSRQANDLDWESTFFKLTAQWLVGNHVITAGFERDELEVFNIFVQHSRGGEWDYYVDDGDDVGTVDFDDNPAHCAGLSSQGRLDDATCGLDGLDKFELGLPSKIYYGSAGGTNVATDAAALFTNSQNTIFIQDELYISDHDLSLVFGLRYDEFESDDRPNFNSKLSDRIGIRNDANIDGISVLQPRFGFTWGARDDLTVRGGLGLYSGGNPNVWLSNAWSNDGVTNVQPNLERWDDGEFTGELIGSVFGANNYPLIGAGRPGYDPPQALFDRVASTGVDNGFTSRTVLLDPNYDQPSEWKLALGATWDMPWWDVTMDVDYLFSRMQDSALYQDVSQERTGTTTAGTPIYKRPSGPFQSENLMLTNSPHDADSHVFSVSFDKSFDNGLDLMLGYAYVDAEDISPMTSFTAGSSFDSTALLDTNNPLPGTSNYVIPHRITLRATWGHEFFDGLETRFTVYGYNQEGQPQSFTMDSFAQENSGNRRHLLYVPSGPNDSNVVYGSGWDADDQAGFDAFIAQEGLARGQFTQRNSHHADWSTRFDFRFDQELPGFGDTGGKLFLKIYNIGNLITDRWGVYTDTQFSSAHVIQSNINSAGQYIFNGFQDRGVDDVIENRSLWEARVGIEFNF